MPSFRAPGLLLLALLAAGCATRSAAPPSSAAPSEAPPIVGSVKIRGTVNYRQRVNLPPNAVVRVQVVDTAAADPTAAIITEQGIATRGAQVPIPFAIELLAEAIPSEPRLVLQAVIEVDRQPRFTSQGHYPLTARTVAHPIEIMVEPVVK
jgi:putative lipoprotein